MLAVPLLVTGVAHAGPEGGDAGPLKVARSPVEVHGELNRPDGAGLPESDYCKANCIEMAVLGDRSVVLARDMNGTPFVAVPITHERDWAERDWVPAEGDPVLDDWFAERVNGDYGVVGLDGTLVAFERDSEGQLTLDLVPAEFQRETVTMDGRPWECQGFFGGNHEHRYLVFCQCAELHGRCYLSRLWAVVTEDCFGNTVGVSYEPENFEIPCGSCPC